METTLYAALAHLVATVKHYEEVGNTERLAMHRETIDKLVYDHLPSGPGFNAGVKLLLDDSTEERLVFSADWHHMDEHGPYCGWSSHTVIVTPSLVYGFKLKVTGTDRRHIKAHILDTFEHALNRRIAV